MIEMNWNLIWIQPLVIFPSEVTTPLGSLLAKDRSASAAVQADLAVEQEALLEWNCLAEVKKKNVA